MGRGAVPREDAAANKKNSRASLQNTACVGSVKAQLGFQAKAMTRPISRNLLEVVFNYKEVRESTLTILRKWKALVCILSKGMDFKLQTSRQR